MSAGRSLAVNAGSPALVRSCWADYVELTRPRLSVMVLFTVAAGSCLASSGTPNLRVSCTPSSGPPWWWPGPPP